MNMSIVYGNMCDFQKKIDVLMSSLDCSFNSNA